MKKNAHKIGSALYVAWGVLHVFFAATLFLALSKDDATAALGVITTAVPIENLPQDPTGAMGAVLAQHAWNLLWFGLFGIIVAVTMNWKNSRIGYWANLLVISAADIGFVFAVLIPGYITVSDGMMGPVLWVLAVIFSTIGIQSSGKSLLQQQS